MSHLLANEAERHISETLAKIAASNAPLTERASGKIDMAYGVLAALAFAEIARCAGVIVAYRRGV